MKKSLLSLSLLVSNIFGQHILHEKIHEAPYHLPCVIEAYLNSPEEEILRFSLLYRSKGSVEFLEVTMQLVGHLKYFAEIPANFMVNEQVEYYFLLDLSFEKNLTLPKEDAIHNPFIIIIDVSSKAIIPITSSEEENFDIIGLNPNILIITPQPGERIRTQDLYVALSFFMEKNINPTRVRVFLDGMDVSNKADIEPTYLSILSKSITPGIHTVTVNITNKYNQKYEDISWSFTVLPEKINRIGLMKKQSGSIRANYFGGNVDNSIMNIGELNFQYEMDFSFLECTAKYTKSSLENKYVQPRDNYLLNLKNKLINIKYGDSYPSIDQYALNDHHVRGLNVSFASGPISLDVINGQTARSVQGNPEKNAMEISKIDSSNDNLVITLSRNNYTFQQDLLAAKMGISLGEKFSWDVNYIKVQDNISTVNRKINDAKIMISPNDSIYSIRYDSLLENYKNIFGENTSINLPTKNWVGTKPRDNFIYGSNIKFGFDDSRIQLNSGFSISFLNRNKWNTIQSIAELDTFAFDITQNWDFLGSIQLNSSNNLSQYNNHFIFGTNQQPMVPFMFKKNADDIISILNRSNLNRYIKLKINYLGHRVEFGNRRNGPDYYSILNPFLKTNFSERYFSNRSNLFNNKLLLYYKWSIANEGLYSDQISPIEVRKSTFNFSLLPGTNLPKVNFGFSSSNRSNNKNIIIDQIFYFNSDSTETDTLTFIPGEEIVKNQFNISMSNQFQLWGNQVMSVNILLFEQKDKVAENIDKDTLLSIGYLPKDAKSESYGISLNSIYNNYWESYVYLNISYYDYGWSSIDEYQIQNLRHMQLFFVYHPKRYITKLNFGLNYSCSWGRSALSNYNFRIGAESEIVENLIIRLNFDYRIKFMDIENNGISNSFIRAYLSYNIF